MSLIEIVLHPALTLSFIVGCIAFAGGLTACGIIATAPVETRFERCIEVAKGVGVLLLIWGTAAHLILWWYSR